MSAGRARVDRRLRTEWPGPPAHDARFLPSQGVFVVRARVSRAWTADGGWTWDRGRTEPVPGPTRGRGVRGREEPISSRASRSAVLHRPGGALDHDLRPADARSDRHLDPDRGRPVHPQHHVRSEGRASRNDPGGAATGHGARGRPPRRARPLPDRLAEEHATRQTADSLRRIALRSRCGRCALHRLA